MIKYTILYCVCKNFCDSILLRFRFPLRSVIKLRSSSDTRFRFRNTASYIPSLPKLTQPYDHSTTHSVIFLISVRSKYLMTGKQGWACWTMKGP
jgi:hypothetical protein